MAMMRRAALKTLKKAKNSINKLLPQNAAGLITLHSRMIPSGGGRA